MIFEFESEININIMKKITLSFALIFFSFVFQVKGQNLAQTPPMGWNSYDCFGAAVLESEVKGNADVMATLLLKHGWEYIVVDYCWSYPVNSALNNPPQDENFLPNLAMDQYGRLLPASVKFPSAADGKGFKPLADYVHSKGLKFGIHVMRGIPREAVAKKLPVKGTKYTADQIAGKESTCGWLNQMYGVDTNKPGAQEYYNSLMELYASWDVDFIKVDDILSPFHEGEIKAVRKAVDRCGRPMVISLSHGATTPVEKSDVLSANSNMWRISADFWDRWEDLKHMFNLTAKWQGQIGTGHWPDADMIPFGRISRRGPDEYERESRFTDNEKTTLMTLWNICRSPLMYGGDLMQLRSYDLKYLTNDEVLKVGRASVNNRQLFRRGNHIAWVADVPGNGDKYLAVFNTGEDAESPVLVSLPDLGFTGEVSIRDLWNGKELGSFQKEFIPLIAPHGAGMYRISSE